MGKQERVMRKLMRAVAGNTEGMDIRPVGDYQSEELENRVWWAVRCYDWLLEGFTLQKPFKPFKGFRLLHRVSGKTPRELRMELGGYYLPSRLYAVSLRDAATMCHTSPGRLGELCRRGLLPAVKADGRWWILVPIKSLLSDLKVLNRS